MWLWTSLGPSLLTAMFRPLLLLLSLGGAVGCGCPGTNQVYVLHKAPMTGWYTFVPGEEGFQLVVSLEDEVDIKYKLVYLRTRQVWMIKEIRSPMINDLFTWNSTSAQGDGVNNVRIFCPGQCKCRKVKVKGHKCFRGYYGRTDVVEQLKRDEIARLEQEALTKAMSLTKGLALMTPPPGPRQLPSTVTKGEGALESLFRQMSGKNKNLPKVKVQSPSSSSSSSTRKTLSRVKRFSMSSQRSRNQQASIDFLRALADDQFHLDDDGVGFQNGRANTWHDDLDIDQVDNSLDKQDDMRDRQVMLTSQLVDMANERKGGLENDQQDDMLSSRLIDMSNGRQANLQNGQQDDMLSSQLLDMTNGRGGSLQDGQQDDMLSSQLLDMSNGRRSGLQNGQQDDMLSSQLLDMANGRRGSLQDGQQDDMLSSQLLDMTNGRRSGLQDGQQVELSRNRQNGRQADMLNGGHFDLVNDRQSDHSNDCQVDLANGQQYEMLDNWQGSRQEGQRDIQQNKRKETPSNEQQDDLLAHLLSAQSQVRQTDSSLVLSNMLPKKPARKKSILQETLAMLNKLSKCVSSPLESLSATEKTPTEPCAAGTHPVPAKSKPKPLRDRTQAKRAKRNFNLTLLQDYKDSHTESQDNEVDEEEIVQCQPDVYAYMSGAEYMITRSETGHFWWIGIGDDLFAVSDEGGPCLDQLPAHTKWMTAIDNKKVKRNANVTVQCVDWDPSYFI